MLASLASACSAEHFSSSLVGFGSSPDAGSAVDIGAAGTGGSADEPPDASAGSGGSGEVDSGGGAPGTGGTVAMDGGSGGSPSMDAPGDTGDQATDTASAGHPVALNGPHTTTLAGSAAGGAANEDDCPAGQALIGFNGSLSMTNTTAAVNRQIAAQCGIVTITGAAVTVQAGTTLPTRGTGGVSAWTRSCPANQVVIGFATRTGTLVDQVTFLCAPLSASSDAVGTALMAGTETSLAPIGGNGGMAFGPYRCAAGEVGSGALVRTSGEISGFALVCSKASIAP